MNQDEFYKGKRITGGRGFLRSFLCERLIAEDADVLCVDNYVTGRRAKCRLKGAPSGGLGKGTEKTMACFRQGATG
jgi:hypothetical protein